MEEQKTHALLTKKGTTVPPPTCNELVKIQLQHDIAVEDDERTFAHDNTWKSCCLTVDRRAVSYISQMGIGVAVITFCISMLVIDQSCTSFSRWSPLLGLVLGVMLPSPRLHRE